MEFANEFEDVELPGNESATDAPTDDQDDVFADIDEMLEKAKQKREDELRDGVVMTPNFQRIGDLETALKKLKHIAKTYNLDVKFDFGDAFLVNGGYIELTCPYGFQTDDVPELFDALKAASNVEFVVEHGQVKVGIMFMGIYDETGL